MSLQRIRMVRAWALVQADATVDPTLQVVLEEMHDMILEIEQGRDPWDEVNGPPGCVEPDVINRLATL